MRLALPSALFAATLLVSAVVQAEPATADKGLAQSLFDQGKKLMAAGKYDQACPKLAESQRLDPGGGTLLNLALCHEKQGKVATAWSEFKEALSAAKRDARQERIAAAEEHIEALEPKLPWLTVNVTGAVAGQEVKLDGAAIREAAWGAPVAVDPGNHELTASAPDHRAWSGEVSLTTGEKRSLTVPALDAEPKTETTAATETLPDADTPSPQSPPRSGSGGRTVGWIVGGAGVAALGVGTYFGLRTLSKKKDSDKLCRTDSTCTPEGEQLNKDAHTSAWITDISVGLGVVGIGVGTFLLLRGGDAAESAGSAARRDGVAFDLHASPSGAELNLAGTW